MSTQPLTQTPRGKVIAWAGDTSETGNFGEILVRLGDDVVDLGGRLQGTVIGTDLNGGSIAVDFGGHRIALYEPTELVRTDASGLANIFEVR